MQSFVRSCRGWPVFCCRVRLRLGKTEAAEGKCHAREQLTEVLGFRHNQKLPGVAARLFR